MPQHATLACRTGVGAVVNRSAHCVTPPELLTEMSDAAAPRTCDQGIEPMRWAPIASVPRLSPLQQACYSRDVPMCSDAPLSVYSKTCLSRCLSARTSAAVRGDRVLFLGASPLRGVYSDFLVEKPTEEKFVAAWASLERVGVRYGSELVRN